ncbi:dihydropteroate synthase [Dehalococcoidales bacterium]|nr:dihydropteroate synthase [Dehalococcoidales bacterium]
MRVKQASMLVIGENINASNRSVAEAIISRDREFLQSLARAQAAAGADFISVNAGTGNGSREYQTAIMEWLVEVVQEATDKPLVIDSEIPSVIKAALGKYRGERLMINSVTAEPEKLKSIGSLAADHQAWLIALAMGTNGIPSSVDQRLAACEQIMTYLTQLGLEAEQIFFDPLILPIAVDSAQGILTLNTLEQIKSHYPAAKTVLGLSNISYGLPRRRLVNRGFLLMAAYAGLDAVILNPLDTKMMSFIKVADMLTGNDPSCKEYIRAHRKGILVD